MYGDNKTCRQSVICSSLINWKWMGAQEDKLKCVYKFIVQAVNGVRDWLAQYPRLMLP